MRSVFSFNHIYESELGKIFMGNWEQGENGKKINKKSNGTF